MLLAAPLESIAQAPATLGTTGPDLGRYLLVCALLIGAVVGLGWGFRRLVARTVKTRAAKRSLEMLDLLPLGSKQRLAVVRCYDRTFALGLGEKEISLIAELDPVVAPANHAQPSRADAQAFERELAKLRQQEEQRANGAQRAGRFAGEIFG